MESVLCGKGDGIERNLLPIAPVLGASLAARIVNQDAAHGLGRRGEEMPSTVPVLDVLRTEQTKVRLMNQGRRLECLARIFLGQPGRRQLPQLFIDQGQELCGRERVALLDGGQDACDIAHWRHRKGERLCGPTSPNPRQPGPAPLPR